MICNYQSWTSDWQGNLREGFQPVLICKFQCLSLKSFVSLLHNYLWSLWCYLCCIWDIMEVLIIKLVPTMQIVSQFRTFVFPALKRRHTRETKDKQKQSCSYPKSLCWFKGRIPGQKAALPKAVPYFQLGPYSLKICMRVCRWELTLF